VPAFSLDTSCIIAAVCGWHEFHGRATVEIEQRLARRDRMLVAAPALVEAYAVLTRLPAPHRLAPANALAVLDANFMRGSKMVALDAGAYVDLLRKAPDFAVSGGRTYDAVIVYCAIAARAKVLLTFNETDFEWSETLGLEVVVPPELSA
jgi:predicted nucleic acid-binding protein